MEVSFEMIQKSRKERGMKEKKEKNKMAISPYGGSDKNGTQGT